MLKSDQLERTNFETVNMEILNALNNLYNNDCTKYENIAHVLSNGASYALKAGRVLKQIIPGLKHVTCLCHGLHNLCETFRNNSKKCNEFVCFFEKNVV
jgi:hypothetical protein